MFVKNTGAKIIGFGTEYLVPGDSGELPKGYGETHPTIKYYIAKGWLTVVKKTEAKAEKPAKTGKPAKPAETAENSVEPDKEETAETKETAV